MKILSVSLYNIASIEGPFTLDLEAEPLKSVGLFAITGATGAGKSTILDAICLALYNETPRLAATKSTLSINDGTGEVQVNNVRNLLRKGATNGYAKVVFQAADAKHYEAEWQVRRARGKQQGNLQQETIQLTNLTDNEMFAENRKTLVLEKIRELIGLSFDEFTKSVILAQGDFTSFLKANDDKRSDILEKLTGTEIYSQISMKVYELSKQHRTEFELLERQLAQLSFLSSADREAIEKQLAADSQQLKALQEELETLKAQQQWFADYHSLSDGYQQAMTEKEKAIGERSAQADRFSQLSIIEQLQAVKADILLQQREEAQLQLAVQQLQAAQSEQQRLATDKAAAEAEKTTAAAEVAAAQSVYETAKPAIDKTKALEVRLAEAQRLLSERQAQQQVQMQQLQDKQKELLAKGESIAKGEQYKQERQAWLNENEAYKLLRDNYQWLQALAVEKEELSRLMAENANKTAALEVQYKALPLKEATFTLEKVLQQQKDYRNQLQVYQADRLLAQHIQTYTTQKEASEALIAEGEQQVAVSVAALTELQKQLSEAQIECKTAERIYERTREENSQNIGLLREKLVEGEACPLCGSLHHPSAHKAISEQLVDTVKQEWEAVQQRLATLSKSIAQKEATQQATLERIAEAQEQQARYHQLVTEAQSQLQQSAFYSTYPTYGLLAYLEQCCADTQERLAASETLFEQLSRLKDFTTQKENLAAQREEYRKQEEGQLKQLGTLQLSEAMLQLWKGDTAAFSAEVTKAKTEYTQQEAHLQKAVERLQLLYQEQSSLATEVTALESQLAQLQTTLQTDTTQYEALKAERQSLLEGEEAAKVEATLQGALTAAKARYEAAQDHYNSLLLKVIANDKTVESLAERQQHSRERIAEATQKVESWIATYYPEQQAYLHAHKVEWANRSHEWLQSERAAQQSLEERIAKYDTLSREKQQQLEALKDKRPLSLSEEETIKIREEKMAAEEPLQQQVIAQKSRLLTDEQQHHIAADLQQKDKEKREVVTQWDKLNSLIGSHSGGLFRRYAQEYTLDVLLQYANVQMKYLNRRYTLSRIPNSLSLQVLDNDMAAEVRSVYSLSGGESFLVSLALALALSSLSSTKMNVETLFIDEGFGSLDTDTLSVALDALESLQNQGKKVGVISHVQEMVERIAVKVVVEKEGNGRSNIVVRS